MLTSVDDLKGFLAFPRELRAKFFTDEFVYSEHAIVRKAVATSQVLIEVGKKWRLNESVSPTFPPFSGRNRLKHESLANLTEVPRSNSLGNSQGSGSELLSDRVRCDKK